MLHLNTIFGIVINCLGSPCKCLSHKKSCNGRFCFVIHSTLIVRRFLSFNRCSQFECMNVVRIILCIWFSNSVYNTQVVYTFPLVIDTNVSFLGVWVAMCSWYIHFLFAYKHVFWFLSSFDIFNPIWNYCGLSCRWFRQFAPADEFQKTSFPTTNVVDHSVHNIADICA